MSDVIVPENELSTVPEDEYYINSRMMSRVVPNFRIPQSSVQVIVGKGKENAKFIVYRDFLTYYSPYFDSALTPGNFKESDGTVELDHVSPDVFGLFVEWLYTQQIEDRQCQDLTIKNYSERELKDRPTMAQLVSLWILADYLQCRKLQNPAMNLMVQKNSSRKVFDTSYLAAAYDSTLPESPLRKVLVDMCSWREFGKEWFLSHAKDLPKEFLLDLVILRTEPLEGCPLYDESNYHVRKSEQFLQR